MRITGVPHEPPSISAEALAEVAKFFEAAPLYRQVTVNTQAILPTEYRQILPAKITMRCGRCDHPTNWERPLLPPTTTAIGVIHSVIYHCANCRQSIVTFFFLGKGTGVSQITLQKIGQYPPQEIHPSKELEKALGDKITFYTKGMTCRHHSFGIGAHAYFRRLIEDTTDDILDSLAAAMREAGEEERAVKKVEDAKKLTQYEDKIEVASEAIPTHLRPGGQNPFALLHELLSRGLHRLSDEDCLDIADDIQEILEFIFKELKAHTEHRKIYGEGLKTILDKVSKKPKRLS